MSEAEAESLEQAFRQASDVRFRDRVPIVRLAHCGRRPQGIAAELGITPRTVQRWLNADCQQGLDGLRLRKAQGAEGKISAERVEEIRR